MTNHQNINADSGNDEYFTPLEIVESARRVMGSIDLDPASNDVANERIKATKIFTLRDNGLNQKWFGNVWLNHPFGKATNRAWIEKISNEYDRGNFVACINICFASTSESWFQHLLTMPQCFFKKRTNYFLPDGTIKMGVTKGSVVTYWGDDVDKFAKEFSKYGVVKIPYE